MNQSPINTSVFSGLGKKFLLWLLILTLVPLSLVSGISYLSARRSLIQKTTQHLSTSLELKKEFIEAFFSERISDLEFQSTLKTNIDFYRKLQSLQQSLPLPSHQLTNHPDWVNLEQSYRPTLDHFKKLYAYHNILFLDPNCKILYSLEPSAEIERNTLQNKKSESMFYQSCRKALQTGKTIISDMEHLSDRGSQSDIYIIHALTNQAKKPIGLIAFDISLQQIDTLLQNRTGLGETGETFLIGIDQIMRSDSWKDTGGKALQTKVSTDLTRRWVTSHQQENDIDFNPEEPPMIKPESYTNHSGIDVFGGIQALENLHPYNIHWAIVAEMAKSEALALVEQLRLITLLLFSITMLIVAASSVAIAKGIALPIRQLSKWAGLMAKGEKVVIEGEEPDDEIGTLMSSFRSMALSFDKITDVCQTIAMGSFQKSIELRSDQDVLGKAVNQMVDNLRAAVRQAELISQGDFSTQTTPLTEDDQLGNALLRMTDKLRGMTENNMRSLDEARILTDHLNNLPTPVLTVDKTFKIKYINTAGAALAGMTSEECLGRFCYELFHNQHCQTKECRVGLAMRTKGVETAETIVSRDDLNLPIRYTGAPILDENGEVIGALEYIIDVSEIKDAFQAIEKENWIQDGVALINDHLRGEQELNQLCGNLLNGLAQRLGAPMGALYVNDNKNLHLYASYSTLGETDFHQTFTFEEGIIGQVAREKRRLIIDDIPEDSIRMVSGILQAAPKHLIVVPLVFQEKVKGVLELGTFVPLSNEKHAFLDRITDHIAIAINTTQSRNQLSELLAKTQQQAEELQSQQEELRVTNEELEAQTMSLKEREEQLQAQHEELLAVNEELEEKTNSLEKQQTDIKTKNAALEKISSDLKKKAEELATASKYKSEFLANMSHELRTPLNSLLLLSHNMAKNKEGNLTEDQVESAEIMYSSGNDLLELINEILDLAKIEAGRVDLDLSEVDPSNLASRLKDSFQAIASEKGLDFIISLAPDIPASIRTDRQRLEQVLRNLISNAVKFTEKGEIRVSFHNFSSQDEAPSTPLNPESTLIISIADTGIGIPKEKQKIIFEAFHQVDGSTSRKYGGTGLGLSISRDLAELLGGEIKLTSIEGHGTTFSLYLPFAVTTSDDNVQSQTPQKRREYNQSSVHETTTQIKRPKPKADIADDRKTITADDKTILIIEDDINFAKTLVKQSHDKGFKCLTSSSGHNGLMIAEEFHPSAVILDINLPDMTGWMVLDALKKNPTLRHIPVHMMSVEEKTLDAYKKGAIGYLNKPVSQHELHAAFDRLENVISSEMRDLLVIEDDEILRQQIVKLVGNGDVTITELDKGSDAIKLLKKKSFDCMVLDIGLPDMSGLELLDRLEQEEDVEIPPVIVYTGRELTREEHDSLYRYTDSIIVKGVKSVERLLDETALFLHRVVDNMPADSRKMIANLYEQDAMFANRKILIVDDDMRNAFALSKILSEKKMNILIANNGKRALEILTENTDIDLVLMDIMMPGMDGYETMTAIRAQEHYWDLPIIALTAKAMPEDKAKCFESGANDYLAKPVEEARLLSMLRIWLYR